MKWCLAAVVLLTVAFPWLHGCRKQTVTSAPPQLASYDSEVDWGDSQKVIALGYQEAQGRRVFYQYFVWCPAEASPPRPSKRPQPTPGPAPPQ